MSRRKRTVTNRMSADDITAVLDTHNDFRSQVMPFAANMQYMSWNADLANMAQEWADHCTGNPPNRALYPEYQNVGQNIYWTSGPLDIVAAVTLWDNEKSSYNYNNFACSGVCGHYTQIVWADSREVGCAINRCSNSEFFVCNYGPAGNFVAEHPYIAGSPCSSCPSNAERCVDRLCMTEVTNRMSADDITAVLDTHNEFRRQTDPVASNMRYMSWNADLANMAQEWADRCVFTLGYLDYVAGQNLYAEYGKQVDVDKGITMWYEGKNEYTYDTNSCADGYVCGQYTQVVWAESREVGCALNSCNDFDFFVCYYRPGENFNTEPPYLLGSPCSACPSDAGRCVDGLCVTEDQCSAAGDDCFCPLQCASCDTLHEDSCTCTPFSCNNQGTVENNNDVCTCDCNDGYSGDHCQTKVPNRMSADDVTAVLDTHNEFRRQTRAANMRYMSWNADLANMAQEWADNCVWEHGNPASPDSLEYDSVGQNLYGITHGKYSGPVDVVVGIRTWYNEIQDYTYVWNTCCSGCNCGHYTQVVSAKSREVGCAISSCNEFEFFVCNYGPANFNPEPPYLLGDPCSACPSDAGWCVDGLCVTEDQCIAAGDDCLCRVHCWGCGTVNEDSCTCACAAGYMGDNCNRECVDSHVLCSDDWPPGICTDTSHKYHEIIVQNCPLLCGSCEVLDHSAPTCDSVCDGWDCHNNGFTQPNGEACQCVCQHGYTGNHCQTSADPCESFSCNNQGTTENNNNICTCDCDDGYIGDHCETKVRRFRVTLVFPDLNCSDGYTESTSEAYQQLVSLIIEKLFQILRSWFFGPAILRIEFQTISCGSVIPSLDIIMDESETPADVAAILRQEIESGIEAQNGRIGEFVVSSVDAEEIVIVDCNDNGLMTRRPIQHYPDLYRGSIIFVDFPFQCSGSVSAVEFYAEHAGTFYFSAWRPSASEDSWTLLGYNTIVSEGEGAQIVTIPSDEQMTVEATDVFGFFYERGVRYRVIPSRNIRQRARDGTSSRFVQTRETLEDLSIGVSRSNLAGDGDTERIVPINAIIS